MWRVDFSGHDPSVVPLSVRAPVIAVVDHGEAVVVGVQDQVVGLVAGGWEKKERVEKTLFKRFFWVIYLYQFCSSITATILTTTNSCSGKYFSRNIYLVSWVTD